MSELPSLKQVWKQVALLGGLAIFATVYARNKVTIRRKQQYAHDASSYDSLSRQRVRSGNTISTIKPGFPEEDGTEKYQRKSEYEGAGSSYMSRRHGDRFNLWDRFWHKND